MEAWTFQTHTKESQTVGKYVNIFSASFDSFNQVAIRKVYRFHFSGGFKSIPERQEPLAQQRQREYSALLLTN